jgi:hypothetical protein
MVDQVALEIRLQLHRCGYSPLPLIGKKPCFKNWQLRTDTSEREIQRWPWMYPAAATNTGVLTRMTPALDLDIMNEEAVLAAEGIVRLRVKHEGGLLVRVGNPPKRAIPFRTDEPFKKLTVLFEPDGDEKIEFLCDGQQFVVAGVHPDIHQPYQWLGRELWTVPREDLPTISGGEARDLVDEIVEMLCQHYGYRIKTASAPPKAHGGSTLHVSSSSASAGQAKHQVPVPLYKKMVELMQPGLGQVRARGILKPVVEARENRNKLLYYAALQFRELIRDGIITRSAVEQLLYLTSEINGYVSKRGRKQTEDTIKSGLEAVRYGRAGLEKET